MARRENLRKILVDTEWKDSVERRRLEFQPTKRRIMNFLAIVFVILAIILAAYLAGYSAVESSVDSGPIPLETPGSVTKSVVVTEQWSIPTRQVRSQDYQEWETATAIPAEPTPDPYAKYDESKVPHPRREPDRLITVKISRYDPQLGGTNCFRWGNGTCLSNLANGEDWRLNYGIAIACPREYPFGTIMEIGGQLWECKDRGGKILGNWVDQLSAFAIYPYGHELLASVWLPGGDE